MGARDNNEQQLLECDRGTVMMARSIQMARGGKVSFITHRAKGKENPPQSDLQEHISAWGMAEVIGYLRRSKISLFKHSCIGQGAIDIGSPTLFGIEPRVQAQEQQTAGKKESQESGEYSWELCNSYANLLMDHFEKMAVAE